MRAFAAATALALSAGAALALAAPPHPRPEPPPSPPPAGLETVHFTGTVTGEDGAALPSAQVVLLGTQHGAVTDAGGRYGFSVEGLSLGGSARLSALLIGYAPVERAVSVAGDTVRTDFVLKTSPVALEEVVVEGRARQALRRALGATVSRLESAAVDASTGSPAYVKATAAAVVANAPPPGTPPRTDPDWNTEAYDAIAENPFLAADANPLSTFSIDVDRASYGNVRRFITQGQLPPRDAVRIEELINYFPYEDASPDGAHPFAVTTQLDASPWKPAHRLLRIGLRARDIDAAALPASNLVFLLDVSGSMNSPDKLPLLKQAFGLLVDQLRPQDRVAIVVYAGAAGLVLPSTPGSDKDAIMAAIDRLEAGGSTAGGAGLRLAYDIARQNHVRGGNNRVILASDGDFNIGESSDAAMVQLIEEKRAQGTFLTVLGFGTGNLKDAKMEKLADHGNGNYAYIDDLSEARKVLVSEFGGTLVAVAKDVKLQVEFNPARVLAYRLIGYENRMLRSEDFDDDRKDAGELGAGHTVTALYEVIPVGAETDTQVRGIDSLRYSRPVARSQAAAGEELAYVKIRYKQPDADTSVRFDHPVADRIATSRDLTFAAAVASFGMTLRQSEHRGSATFAQAIALASDALGEDRGGYRAQFIELVRKAQTLQTVADAGGR